jgi:hypothetical protein
MPYTHTAAGMANKTCTHTAGMRNSINSENGEAEKKNTIK